MIRFPFLLFLLVWYTTADWTTKLSLHYSEVLKIKCDALPYRTAFIESNCYIVIDNDGSDISSKCSTVLTGAKFVGDAPESVWIQLFVEKDDFALDETSTGKKKAMCVFESQFPPSSNLPTLIAGTTVRQEELKLTAAMKMPFRLPFTKPVEVGRTIIIKGFFTAAIPHIMINLQSGTQNMFESERLKQDISFHAYFRPIRGTNLGGNTNYPGEVVLKTMIKGGRHRQEAACRKKNPLGRGSFDIRIRILENAYQLFVNQTEFFVYQSYLSYNRIANLYIDGNGYLDFVQLGESYDPVPYSALQQTTSAKTSRPVPNNGFSVKALPYVMKFAEKLEPGRMVVLKGYVMPPSKGADVQPKGSMLTVWLQSSAQNVRQSINGTDVPFHFNFRYSGQITFNTLHKGKWGADESKTNPFKIGDTVDIHILILENGYKLFLNQKEFYVYKSRAPYTLISHLFVNEFGFLTQAYLDDKIYKTDNSSPFEVPIANSPSKRVETKDERKPLPYILPLTEKIEPGRMLVVNGFRIPPTPNPLPRPDQMEYWAAGMFMLYLQSGDQDLRGSWGKKNADAPLHFGFRMHMGHMSINSLRKGYYGAEERKPIPFKTGDLVNIRIQILQNGFQIFFNDREFYVYKSRMPFTTAITHLRIFGNGSITEAYLEEKYIPIPLDSSFANGFPMCYKESCSTQREWYTSRVPVADCKSLLISGMAQGQNFAISLVSKNGNIALKFNPRFDKKNVGLNSFKNKQWLVEETVHKLPFEKNVPFDVAITNEAAGFQIFVNGDHFTTFVHRTCPFDINVVEIEGVFDLNVQVK